MKKILFNATPFGYGPVAKILSIIREFVNRGYECVFVGSGIAYEYVHRENICEVIEIDIYNEDGVGRNMLLQLSKNFAYGLTAMEPLFVEYCSPNLKIGYIDSLFWMWDQDYFHINHKLKHVDMYFAQNVFHTGDCPNKDLIDNFIQTNSIIDYAFMEKKIETGKKIKKSILIHFGGVENVIVPFKDIVFPFKMFEILDRILAERSLSTEITVASSEKTIKKLQQTPFLGHYMFRSLDHKDFASMLQSCDLLLTTPGLTTLIEAFSINKKIVFLIPQNYSQYLIINKVKDAGYPYCIDNLSSFYSNFHIDSNMTEGEGVAYIIRYIDIFFHDQAAVGQYSVNLRSIVDRMLDDKDAQKLEAFQNEFIRQVGINGVGQIYAEVVKRLQNKLEVSHK